MGCIVSKTSDWRIPNSSFGLESIYERIFENGHKNEKNIGEGASGEVYLMRDKSNNRPVAVKVFRAFDADGFEHIQKEIIIQAMLSAGNNNIVKSYEFVLTKTHLCLILEYAEKGSMCDYVLNKLEQLTNDLNDIARAKTNLCLISEYVKRRSMCDYVRNKLDQRENDLKDQYEEEVSDLFRQIIKAVIFCHDSKVMHRDLKPDNILLFNSNPPVIKLCDFGLAKSWGKMQYGISKTRCGTPVFMSPEVLRCESEDWFYLGRQADIWSLGIILFMLFNGFYPYDFSEEITGENKIYEKIKELQEKYTWKDRINSNYETTKHVLRIPSTYEKVLDRILTFDPSKRINIAKLTKFPYIRRNRRIKRKKDLDRNKFIHKTLNGILIRSNESKRRSILLKKLFTSYQTYVSEKEDLNSHYLISLGKVKRLNLNSEIY
jgi:serine/threonine protein kinase